MASLPGPGRGKGRTGLEQALAIREAAQRSPMPLALLADAIQPRLG